MAEKKKKIVVVGGGIMGISSAYILQQTGLYDVTIFTESLSPNRLASDIGGAIIRPGYLGETDKDKILSWSADTFAFLQRIIYENKDAGIHEALQAVSCYEYFQEPLQPWPFWSHIVNGFRNLEPHELPHHWDCAGGWFYTSFIIEGRRYLPYLLDKFKRLGGGVELCTINSFAHVREVVPHCSLIVNCTGLYGLVDEMTDPELRPARGVTIQVHAPWVKHAYGDYCNVENPTYIYPRADHLILGGTYELGRGTDDGEPTTQEVQNVIARCSKMIPGLSNSRVLDVRAGSRPYRKEVRLELQTPSDVNALPVIHNYGHGGAGWTVHFGCAHEVAKLAVEYLNPELSLSKL
eukprot:m.32298 g.32298  ORF g.32298 m.32298 type:complete len:350 (-) comp8396_c0_seq1:119-1168(-)